MIGVALKGLAGRKVRALLTALAVVIGISMVSGTYILTDTMQKSFDGLFTATLDETDAVISGKEIVKGTTTGSAKIPAALLTKVQKLDQVEAAGGVVSPDQDNAADIIGPDGKAVARESVAASYDAAHADFSPLSLKSGSWPEGPKQVVIDAGTAAKQHYKVGDAVKVSTFGAKRSYELTGIVRYGEVDSLGFASIAAWDLKTAQTLLHREGSYDSISISAKEGTSAKELVRAVAPLVPGSLQVKDSAKQAKDEAAGAQQLDVDPEVLPARLRRDRAARRRVRDLQHAVDHRRPAHTGVRDAADARRVAQAGHAVRRGRGHRHRPARLGDRADRRHRAREGHGRAVRGHGRRAARRRHGHRAAHDHPLDRRRHADHPGGEHPAREAGDPRAADRGGPRGLDAPASRFAAHTHKTGVVVATVSLVALLAGLFAGGLSTIGLVALLGGGVLGVFLGMALLAPRLVTPLARFVGWPARRRGIAGELAGANAVRNPGRTASTAAALMIGLTLVTLVAVLASSLATATKAAIEDEVHAGYVIDGKDNMPFTAAEGDELAKVPGVKSASHVRSDTVLIDGKERAISGIDPATIAHFYTFTWAKGSEQSLGKLGTDGAIVKKGYAEDNKLAIGSSIAITMPSGAKRTLVVRGIHKNKTAAAGRRQHDPAGIRQGLA